MFLHLIVLHHCHASLKVLQGLAIVILIQVHQPQTVQVIPRLQMSLPHIFLQNLQRSLQVEYCLAIFPHTIVHIPDCCQCICCFQVVGSIVLFEDVECLCEVFVGLCIVPIFVVATSKVVSDLRSLPMAASVFDSEYFQCCLVALLRLNLVVQVLMDDSQVVPGFRALKRVPAKLFVLQRQSPSALEQSRLEQSLLLLNASDFPQTVSNSVTVNSMHALFQLQTPLVVVQSLLMVPTMVIEDFCHLEYHVAVFVQQWIGSLFCLDDFVVQSLSHLL